MTRKDEKISRRQLLRSSLRGAALVGIGVSTGALLLKAGRDETVWQIDPLKCVACGNCATNCVLETSAVKCVHAYAMCGYCDLCFGYFDPKHEARTSAAENQLCPVGAIKRTYIEDPYYQYTIDETLCLGCGKCVRGCVDQGNGSLYLQVRHDRCLNCSQCSIAEACPSGALIRVPASQPYLPKDMERKG